MDGKEAPEAAARCMKLIVSSLLDMLLAAAAGDDIFAGIDIPSESWRIGRGINGRCVVEMTKSQPARNFEG